MGRRLKTKSANTHGDVAAFFDVCAAGYSERHGDPELLLPYRLELIRGAARLDANDTVLEIGCGSGLHLLALAGEFARGIGTDLSPAMIEAARRRAAETGHGNITFAVDAGEHLSSVPDDSIDVALCVGALEHMLGQAEVLRTVFRVLKRGGRLVCLTLNGGSIWYRYLAPVLGFDTRQLATDRYLSRGDLYRLTRGAGFEEMRIDSWTFVQRGDMPAWVASLLGAADRAGKFLGLDVLRGGLRLCATK
jgi:SAM-dependent methyltransferase